MWLGLIFISYVLCLAAAGGSHESSKPNILFFFTDDQDLHLGSMNYLNSVTERIQKKGYTFESHYATVALCCPSRVAILRGQHAHNTNITYVVAPGGGYDKFRLSGESQNYLPHWLRKAGYRSEYIGKLMNQYGIYNWQHKPPGWDHFDGLLDPYTYIYNTPVFSANGERPVYYPGAHQTDVIRAKAVDRLDHLLANESQPWFLEVAMVAPHQNFNATGRYPPIAAARHLDLYPGLKAPRSKNFNPVLQNKPSWLGELPRMTEEQIAFSDATYRGRAQSLQGVEELIEHMMDVLEAAGKLEETVIIFSTDHGYHVGNHRVPAGKTLPYREDTHVPFIIKGPGVPKGESTKLPSNHVDIAPTVLSFTGLPQSEWPVFLDGRDLSTYWTPTPAEGSNADGRCPDAEPEVINIEFWGSAVPEGMLNITKSYRNSYKTLRVVGPDYGYLYSHWCTNETELYDTVADPYELDPIPLSSKPNLANRLNALLLVTKSCTQGSCRDPWKTLHPDSSVRNLKQALNPCHDAYYASLPRVAIKECLSFQLADNEVPFFPGFVPSDPSSFAQQFRIATDDLGNAEYPGTDDAVEQIPDLGPVGWVYQDLKTIEKDARELSDAELESGARLKRAPYY